MKKRMTFTIVSLCILMTTLFTPLSSQAATDRVAPSKPTSLKPIERGEDFVRLNWSASTDNVGVSYYEIYLSNKKIGTVSSLYARVYKLSPSTQYAFNIAAVDKAGNRSHLSDTLYITTKNLETHLEAPRNLKSVEVGTDFIRIDWDAPANASDVHRYGVYLDGKRIGSVTSTHARIYSLKSDERYKIYVVSLDKYGMRSDGSNTISVRTKSTTQAVPAPIHLTPVEITDDTFRFKWKNGSGAKDIKGYYIYLDGKRIGSVSNPYARVYNLKPYTSYVIHVVAYDKHGHVSPKSKAIKFKTYSTIEIELPAPPNLRSSEVTKTSVRIKWDIPTTTHSISGYKVYLNNVELGMVSSNAAYISNLLPGTKHEYRVVAVGANGKISSQSQILSVTTLN